MDFPLTERQKEIIRFYHHNPFIDYIRAQVVPLPDGTVELRLTIEQQHTNLYNIVHGGVLMTLADTAMGAAALARNKKVVTMSLSMDFMHAVPLAKTITATGICLHDGSHAMTLESEIVDAEGKLYAKAHGTFYVLGKFIEDEE
ncbi:PaaI family thioesterase [Selenomonas sputigena]|uniref:PaaI family thioesterase n=1 Tax=Selenomonas sputigena TaxID=69823 RepID=A0ABV3X6G2_9FIRM